MIHAFRCPGCNPAALLAALVLAPLPAIAANLPVTTLADPTVMNLIGKQLPADGGGE